MFLELQLLPGMLPERLMLLVLLPVCGVGVCIGVKSAGGTGVKSSTVDVGRFSAGSGVQVSGSFTGVAVSAGDPRPEHALATDMNNVRKIRNRRIFDLLFDKSLFLSIA